MRRFAVPLAAAATLVFGISGTALGAPADGRYEGKNTSLEVIDGGTAVVIYELPVQPKCKGDTPSDPGDFGAGLRPFDLDRRGRFANYEGKKPFPGMMVITGKFSSDGGKVTGKVIAPKLELADGSCAKFRAKWSATPST